MPENIELYYSVVSNIYFIAGWFISGFCLVKLCLGFMKKSMTSWAVGAAYFICAFILYYIPVQIENFAAYSIAVLVSFLVLAGLSPQNIRMKIVLVSAFFVLRWISFALSTGICDLLSDFALNIIGKFASPANASDWVYYYAEYAVGVAVNLIISFLILYFLVIKISKALLYQSEDLTQRELVFMLIPCANGIIIYGLFRFYAAIYESELSVSIYDGHAVLNVLWVLCYIVILAVLVSTLTLYQDIRKRRDEENALLLMESQVKDVQSHIERVEKLYANIRGMKHDMKNHVEVINSLLAQGRSEDALKYTKNLSDAAEILDFPIKTGNPVTDVVINEKMRQAEDEKIIFSSEFHYPADTEINAFDMSVILSNALSNAIEAAGTGGFIKISSFRNKNAFLITVENSYAGVLNLKAGDALPPTTKSDKSSHGFGLKNIKAVAAKYDGDVLLDQKEGVVTLTVMMQV